MTLTKHEAVVAINKEYEAVEAIKAEIEAMAQTKEEALDALTAQEITTQQSLVACKAMQETETDLDKMTACMANERELEQKLVELAALKVNTEAAHARLIHNKLNTFVDAVAAVQPKVSNVSMALVQVVSIEQVPEAAEIINAMVDRNQALGRDVARFNTEFKTYDYHTWMRPHTPDNRYFMRPNGQGNVHLDSIKNPGSHANYATYRLNQTLSSFGATCIPPINMFDRN